MTAPIALIAFAEALASPESAWSLADAGFSVRGRRRNVVIHEVTALEDDYSATHAEVDELLTTLSGAESGKHVALPLDDAALWVFSRHAESPRWVFAGPRGSAAEFALDKPLQIAAALAAGMNVPPTSTAYAPNDVLARARAATGPSTCEGDHVVGKPTAPWSQLDLRHGTGAGHGGGGIGRERPDSRATVHSWDR